VDIALDSFIPRGDIAEVVDQLTLESDPYKRAALVRLLVPEEDRLGGDLERLDQAQTQIVAAVQRIAKQQALVEQLEQDGKETTIARALLEGMKQTHVLFQYYRQKLLDRVDQSKL
jgi:flagellar biosynthesis/type III secretory pathway protein FliH